METSKIAALGLFGLAAWSGYTAYQNATTGDRLAQLGRGTVTPENCMNVRDTERQAFQPLLIASAAAIAGTYLWMR